VLGAAAAVPAADATQVMPATGALPAQPTGPVPTPPREEDKGKQSVWPWMLLGAAVAVLVLIAFLLFGGEDDTEPEREPTQRPTRSATQSPSQDAGIEIDEDDYLGRNVDEV